MSLGVDETMQGSEIVGSPTIEGHSDTLTEEDEKHAATATNNALDSKIDSVEEHKNTKDRASANVATGDADSEVKAENEVADNDEADELNANTTTAAEMVEQETPNSTELNAAVTMPADAPLEEGNIDTTASDKASATEQHNVTANGLDKESNYDDNTGEETENNSADIGTLTGTQDAPIPSNAVDNASAQPVPDVSIDHDLPGPDDIVDPLSGNSRVTHPEETKDSEPIMESKEHIEKDMSSPRVLEREHESVASHCESESNDAIMKIGHPKDSLSSNEAEDQTILESVNPHESHGPSSLGLEQFPEAHVNETAKNGEIGPEDAIQADGDPDVQQNILKEDGRLRHDLGKKLPNEESPNEETAHPPVAILKTSENLNSTENGMDEIQVVSSSEGNSQGITESTDSGNGPREALLVQNGQDLVSPQESGIPSEYNAASPEETAVSAEDTAMPSRNENGASAEAEPGHEPPSAVRGTLGGDETTSGHETAAGNENFDHGVDVDATKDQNIHPAVDNVESIENTVISEESVEPSTEADSVPREEKDETQEHNENTSQQDSEVSKTPEEIDGSAGNPSESNDENVISTQESGVSSEEKVDATTDSKDPEDTRKNPPKVANDLDDTSSQSGNWIEDILELKWRHQLIWSPLYRCSQRRRERGP